MPALNSYGFQAWLNLCTASVATIRSAYTPTVGLRWDQGTPGASMGSILLPPNPPYPNCNSGVTGTFDASLFNMTSFHPGGANILLADGSVHFLKNSVAM